MEESFLMLAEAFCMFVLGILGITITAFVCLIIYKEWNGRL